MTARTARCLCRTALGLAFAALASLALAAQAEESWPRQVDNFNGPLRLEHPPQRIVSTSVTLTGSLLAIDAPVIASGATAPNNRFADGQGYFRQWGEVAAQRQVKRLYIGEANAEAVAAQAPDLIVVSASGADSALALYEQFSSIAPTLVINYDDHSWEEVVQQLGRATGHEAQAAQRIEDVAARVTALKGRLQLPAQPVSAFVYNAPARQANLWTAASAQGRLLQSLGFTLAQPPADLPALASMGKRKDILQLGGEHLAAGLTGQTWLLFAGETADAEAVKANALLAHLPAVREQRVYALGADTFRLDYYSAGHLLDRLEAQFAAH
ncbi:Fe2+-enterobactin ABC transporter substrate-binding protein [Pseudomonas sp. RIT-PI-S]|uniref:Fe2+-enterobactin ABC transporter substrate-binding protein n=1 Tax=Pseudomonas sp. RIT-PI-S TaxID=3035295 RepID=UPI0021D9CB10|nr:Fe2+-enterobactin ABC transporter substrate-binding protein [Pseudomonas sp. RIT-PI-S]